MVETLFQHLQRLLCLVAHKLLTIWGLYKAHILLFFFFFFSLSLREKQSSKSLAKGIFWVQKHEASEAEKI